MSIQTINPTTNKFMLFFIEMIDEVVAKAANIYKNWKEKK